MEGEKMRLNWIIEDFVPESHCMALVTTGPSFTRQPHIIRVPYICESDGRVSLYPDGRFPVAEGEHLRLGDWHNSHLVYSDSARGIVNA